MWRKTTVIALILATCSMAQQSEEDKKKEEEAKGKIADYRKELKNAKTDKDVARAIEGLGALQHPKILLELKGYLSKGVEEAIAAAEQIGKYKKDKDAAESLTGAVSARKEKEAIVKFLRYAGDTEFKGILPKLTGFFRNKDTDAAKEAVDSCAKIKSRDAIDPLLNLWKELDSVRDEKANDKGGGIGSGGVIGGVGASMQDEQLKRKRDLTPAVEAALKKITGEEFKDLRAANDWWRKNKGSFKDPE
jgi:hypothetical protein